MTMTMTMRPVPVSARLIWPATIAVSLIAHAGLAMWLMQIPLGQMPGPGVEAIEVVLVAAEPAPAPMDEPMPLAQPQPDPPPAPQPVAVPEDAAPPVPPDAPDLAEVAAPETLPDLALPEVMAETAPIVTPRPRAKPAPKPEAKPAPKPAAKPAKPEAKSEVKPAAAAPAATASAGGGSRDSWMADARRKIERRKRYPSAARGATGTVTLAVSVAASGALSGVSVAGSSGNAALDEAAASAVRRAAPFKPSAAGYNFTVPMVFNRK